MQVLGTVNATRPSTFFDPEHLLIYTTTSSTNPSVFCPTSCGISVQVVVFDRPSPYQMQYMSPAPISLVLADKPLNATAGSHGLSTAELEEEEEKANKDRLVEKLKLHTVTRHAPSQKERLLPTILAQMNCSSELEDLITSNAYLLRTRQKRSLSVGEKVVESATSLRDYLAAQAWHIALVLVFPVVTRAFIMLLITHRILAEVALRVIEWRPRPGLAALKDISATAQQVDIRLQQFCYWPIQYLTLRKRKDDWESITDRHPDYIRFFNSLWLVANDIIIGIALGSYILDNADWVAWQINIVLNSWTVEGLRDMISWLMDWPAGLKLNNELAVFLGDLFLWVIDLWRGVSLNLIDLHAATDLRRMRCRPATLGTACNLLYWLFQLRRSHDANCHVLRPPLRPDHPHLLLLHRFRPYFPLAAYHNNVAIPPLSREKAQRLTESNRLM